MVLQVVKRIDIQILQVLVYVLDEQHLQLPLVHQSIHGHVHIVVVELLIVVRQEVIVVIRVLVDNSHLVHVDEL